MTKEEHGKGDTRRFGQKDRWATHSWGGTEQVHRGQILGGHFRRRGRLDPTDQSAPRRLDLSLEGGASGPSSSSPPSRLHTLKVPAKENGQDSCNFCKKKFETSQARGGHQDMQHAKGAEAEVPGLPRFHQHLQSFENELSSLSQGNGETNPTSCTLPE